jgi:hypothetical protein
VRIITTVQEFNKIAEKLVKTDYFLGLPANIRSDFTHDVERARSLEKLTLENRFIWKRAEAEIKRKETVKK